MERIKPKLKDKLNVPVNIYKAKTLVFEAISIQEAARWLKEETGDKFKRFSAITKGIWYYKPYRCNGSIYYFETDPQAVVQYFQRINRQIIARLVSTHPFDR
ncbi:hypothetical protein IHV12_04830 [Fictibacillus sp. 7GRE50]|uniref:hypothetical protein n=1 Tax=Fictibacillus sp. 7GRE50 TaxID=2745878 RepID=UPI0018CD6BBD|nr:hypothetical protein [Fictibacillus sp. 7GRE50]MBH0164227.1 hypothetical protein [Fictibacillus sp. 7GRE50]